MQLPHLNVHVLAKHKGVKIACDQCNFFTMYKYTLKIHGRVKHEEIVSRCDECNKTFTKQAHVTRHKKRKHTGVIKAITRHKLAPKDEIHNIKEHMAFIHDVLVREEDSIVSCDSEETLSHYEDNSSENIEYLDKSAKENPPPDTYSEIKAFNQYYRELT